MTLVEVESLQTGLGALLMSSTKLYTNVVALLLLLAACIVCHSFVPKWEVPAQEARVLLLFLEVLQSWLCQQQLSLKLSLECQNMKVILSSLKPSAKTRSNESRPRLFKTLRKFRCPASLCFFSSTKTLRWTHRVGLQPQTRQVRVPRKIISHDSCEACVLTQVYYVHIVVFILESRLSVGGKEGCVKLNMGHAYVAENGRKEAKLRITGSEDIFPPPYNNNIL